MINVGDLSNEELLARLRVHIGKGHVWQAHLLAYIAEVEHRRLYAEFACSSIWDFCVRKLGMSESEAHRRIAAARVIRQFPRAFGHLERGELHLCAVYTLRKHLTTENHEELLREASGKTTQAVEALIAARFPRPDVPGRIEPVEPQASLPVALAASCVAGAAPVTASQPATPAARPKVEPLSATRYRVELTISAEMRTKLERVKDLMRHRNPAGDLETILDASLDLLLTKLEKERLGKTSRPKTNKGADAEKNTAGTTTRKMTDTDARATSESAATNTNSSAHGQHFDGRTCVSRDARRTVFTRDGEQCTYVDADGERCPARGYLELDHIQAKALGGNNDAENLRIRCRTHNRLHAERVFGRKHVEEKIQSRRRKSAPATSPQLETAAKALRIMGFREPEVRKAVAILEATLDTKNTSLEVLVREGISLLT